MQPMTEEQAMQFRKILEGYLRRSIKEPKRGVALMLSGGTDSLTLFWCLKKLGIPFRAYTYFLSTHRSQDLACAEKVCRIWEVPHVLVEDVWDSQKVRAILQKVVTLAGDSKKTVAEVLYPNYVLLDRIEEHYVLNGHLADTMNGSFAWMCIEFRNATVAEFTEMRKQHGSDGEDVTGATIQKIARQMKKEMVLPYRNCQDLRNWFYQFSHSQLNHPKQKMHSILAFWDEFSRAKVYRRNSPMQVNSLLREKFEEEFGGDQRKFYRSILERR